MLSEFCRVTRVASPLDFDVSPRAVMYRACSPFEFAFICVEPVANSNFRLVVEGELEQGAVAGEFQLLADVSAVRFHRAVADE